MMKEYGHLLADDPDWADRAARTSARVRDVTELLAAAGTLLAALAAFVSAGLLVLGLDTTRLPAASLLAVWGVGVLMQIAAGAVARWRD